MSIRVNSVRLRMTSGDLVQDLKAVVNAIPDDTPVVYDPFCFGEQNNKILVFEWETNGDLIVRVEE